MDGIGFGDGNTGLWIAEASGGNGNCWMAVNEGHVVPGLEAYLSPGIVLDIGMASWVRPIALRGTGRWGLAFSRSHKGKPHGGTAKREGIPVEPPGMPGRIVNEI